MLGFRKSWHGRWSRLAMAVGVAIAAASPVLAQDLVGVPLNAQARFVLDADLGAGKTYAPSLQKNFQDWGAQVVSAADGFPVRLGEQSIRFETREGFCGWDEGIWSDCENGRSRHELSSSSAPDPWDKDIWYSISLYIPDEYGPPGPAKTSIFQFWSGGEASWMFKYEHGRGFYVQRKLDDVDTIAVEDGAATGRWIDYLLRIRHSVRDTGSLTLWANGQKVYDYSGRTALGGDMGAVPYFKFGIYNTAMGPDGAPVGPDGFGNGEGLPTHHLFFDEVRYSETCAGLVLGDLGYDCADFSYEGADAAQVKQLQAALNALGCDVGTVDGVIGRRTVAAATTCRQFGVGEMPATLSTSTIATFASLYEGAAEQNLPVVERVVVSSAFSEIVGGNSDNALNVEAKVGDIDLDFILIGKFDDTGRSPWLDILFLDDLGDVSTNSLMTCRRVRTEDWGDSTHVVAQFTRMQQMNFRSDGGECLEAALPPGIAEELTYLLDNFQVVATALADGNIAGVKHGGLEQFLDAAARGEITVGRP